MTNHCKNYFAFRQSAHKFIAFPYLFVCEVKTVCVRFVTEKTLKITSQEPMKPTCPI